MSRTTVAKAGGLAVLVAVMAVFPLVFTNPSVTEFGVLTVFFIGAASSWNTFSGYSGYVSLGSAVFFGSGAYLLGLIAEHLHMTGFTVFALVPLAGVLAAAIAVPFGLVALRVRRHTFVVITIAVFFIFQLLAFNLSFTGGSQGVISPAISLSPSTFNDPFYYIGFAIAVCAVLMSLLIRRSRFGLRLLAIRDDEDRARGLGVPVTRIKLTSFVVSAIPIGMIGALWMFFIGQVLPQYGFDPTFDLAVALMAFLGGLGTVSGPVLGAMIVEPLQQWLTLQFNTSDLSLIVEGALFLAVILLLPRGIIPTVTERFKLRAARTAGQEARAEEKPQAPPGVAHDAGVAPRGGGAS
jgi:branched-chain amino acid transport system permease protein